MTSLLAVHISDGLLDWPWLVGGFAAALALGWLGSRRLADEEIPRVAVLTAAFYVATLIHVPIPLPFTRAHLLLNGLVGLILGPRAALAIPLALFLQALLLTHGGLSVLGVNTCIMLLPALGCWAAFTGLKRLGWVSSPRQRWLLGFIVGGLGVMATACLNALVLWLGGGESLSALAVAVVLVHVPIAVVEAFVMAAAVNFLAQVKPEMLGLTSASAAALPAPPVEAERRAG